MRALSGHLIVKIAMNDFRLTWKERSSAIWIFLMPLAFIFFFGISFRSSQHSTPKAKLTIDNEDEGFLPGRLIELLRRENLYLVDADTLAPGDRAVRTLLIPPGFTDKILSREKTGVILRKDEGSNINAGEAVSVAVFRGLAGLVTSLLVIEEGVISSGGGRIVLDGDEVRGNLKSMVDADRAYLPYLESKIDSILAIDRAVRVRAVTAGREREIPRGFQSSVPGNLVMFVLMSMLFAGAGLSAERADGILRRLGMTPAGKGDVVAGKILGRMMVSGLQIAFLLASGKILFGISLGGGIPALLILMAAFALCTGALSIFFGALFRNPDQVIGFAIVTSLVMAALGGCWWPLEVVSTPFRVIAFLFPTGWALNGLHRILSFGQGISSIAPHAAVLVLFALVFMAAAGRRMKWEI